KIMPPSGEKTYFHWLENIEPWCISRQLWWGHQIPVWYDEDGNYFCAPTEEEAIRGAAQHYGGLHPNSRIHIDIGDNDDDRMQYSDLPGRSRPAPHTFVFDPSDFDNLEVDADKDSALQSSVEIFVTLSRDPDVLDTWFSSGLWPIGTLGWPEATPELKKYFPTDVLITGSDILFFWVARMMMMQLAVVGEVPFHTVYLHGLVRDAKGKKMSKSLGNVVDPLDLIDEFGADALRFTNAAMASLGGVLKLDTQRIAGYRNFGTKLWNATRFAEMNGVFDAPLGRPAPAHTVNRWIIGEVARTREAVDDALTNFRFNDAANTLYAFVWGKVCDWYVEFAKPLFDGDHAAETRQTMRWVLDQCFLMLHPIMPFLTEELWAMTGARAKMLVHGDWPEYGAELIDAEADREMNWVIALIEEIRSARSQMGVPAGLRAELLYDIGMNSAASQIDVLSRMDRNRDIIQRLARVQYRAAIMDSAPRGAITIAVEGGVFALPLAGIIDVAGEKARLTKAFEKLEKDMNGLRGRLNNPKFVASAPEEVVGENRELLAAGEAEGAKIRAALARLADLG
ncbi:MAG: class I tRNA ligase family protein, partial [Phaeovulum sp.]|uniref:class I tRNA ligase family protein n=1 Tax=Phaeovulum sp. TaxID=2934796 RepID=UPI00273354DC